MIREASKHPGGQALRLPLLTPRYLPKDSAPPSNLPSDLCWGEMGRASLGVAPRVKPAVP